MKWDKENPLHREIMEAGKEAFIKRRLDDLEKEMDSLISRLPWFLRVYMRVYMLIKAPFRTRFYAYCQLIFFRLRRRISWVISHCMKI